MKVVEVAVEATYDLRRRVLRDGRADAVVQNPGDDVPGAFHLAAIDDDDAVVAVASCAPEPSDFRPAARSPFRLRGMAVEPSLQGQGIGAVLLDAAVSRLRMLGADVVWANGRDTALGFYEQRGWTVLGDGFITVGIPHHVVLLDLD